MNVLDKIELEQMRLDIPAFRPGDTVKVHIKIREGEKDRIQVFQGIVIARKNAAMRSSFRLTGLNWCSGAKYGVHGCFICATLRVKPPALKCSGIKKGFPWNLRTCSGKERIPSFF